jgi:hypothetical protein
MPRPGIILRPLNNHIKSWKPDISPDRFRRNSMKSFFLAAIAVLSLTAAIAPAANAYTRGFPHTTYHQGPYDNTGNGPGETGMEGGGG